MGVAGWPTWAGPVARLPVSGGVAGMLGGDVTARSARGPVRCNEPTSRRRAIADGSHPGASADRERRNEERTWCDTHVARRAGHPAARVYTQHPPQPLAARGANRRTFPVRHTPLARRERSDPFDGSGNDPRGNDRGPVGRTDANRRSAQHRTPQLQLGQGEGVDEVRRGRQERAPEDRTVENRAPEDWIGQDPDGVEPR